eukprot:COSAG04_NODE_4478_length_2065_cov_2.803154_3_plen_184_part_00
MHRRADALILVGGVVLNLIADSGAVMRLLLTAVLVGGGVVLAEQHDLLPHSATVRRNWLSLVETLAGQVRPCEHTSPRLAALPLTPGCRADRKDGLQRPAGADVGGCRGGAARARELRRVLLPAGDALGDVGGAGRACTPRHAQAQRERLPPPLPRLPAIISAASSSDPHLRKDVQLRSRPAD